MILLDPRKSACPFCGQLFVRLGGHLSRCKERQGREYTSYLAKHPTIPKTNQRGRCPTCNRVFKRLDTHFRTSATCKRLVSSPHDSPCTAQLLSQTMNTAPCAAQLPLNTVDIGTTVDTGTATPTLQLQPAVSVPSTLNHIQLPPPFNMPKSDEDGKADYSSLGSILVHQVLAAKSVDDKNMVLCEGIYNHFSSKYGLRKTTHPRKPRVKRHNRAFKKPTQEKNTARRELRAAKREGKEKGTIKEIATKFHQLIRLHSKAKREQLRSRLNLEAGKARQECAKNFLRFAAKIFDGEDETPEPAFSAEDAESFFKEVYSTSPRPFQRPSWLPEANSPHCAFNDDPITTSEISGVIKRINSSSSPSPIDRVSYRLFKKCPALVQALVDLFNACWVVNIHT